MKSSRLQNRGKAGRWIAAALSAALLVPLAAIGTAAPAQAKDGTGDGQNVVIAVAADGFSTSKVGAVNIQTSAKYPGTVRFVRVSDGKCLATKDGNNGPRATAVQWTGCNGDSSKNWVVEPLSTSSDTSEATLNDTRDDTIASLNTVDAGEQPRFIIRSYKYPTHCLFSSHGGLNTGIVGSSGTIPNCNVANTKVGSTSGMSAANTTHFAIMNDTKELDEWEYLRKKMYVGAIAMYQRGVDGQFKGENFWVKPMSTDGEYVGLERKASTGGFFTPEAVEIDPAKEGAVVARTSSADSCEGGSWWWGLDNSHGLSPMTQELTSSEQLTDEFGWSAGLEVGHEAEGSILFLKGKFTVKVNGSINKSWSTAKTKSQTVTMSVPAGLWGMAVATTPSVSTLGNWMTGTALDRPWKFMGMSTVALKNNKGEPTGTILAHIDSHERKSCLAQAETSMPAGVTPTIELPEGRLAPQVGDTVIAVAPFIDPKTGNNLDIRYQWYADDKPISNQTLQTLKVTSSMVGKKLQFRTYESGGSMRFESQTLESEQTAPVTEVGLGSSSGPVELPEAIQGRDFEVSLANVPGMSGALTLDETALPAGLSFDASTGMLSGVAETPGIFTLQLTDEHATSADLTLTVDAAPTGFALEIGATVEVDSPIELPLIEEVGTDASYSIEALNTDGTPAVLPAGVSIDVNGSGAPQLVGTPTSTGTVLVRVTELSPHHDAGDSRETTRDFILQVAAASSSGGGEPAAPTEAPEVSIERLLEDGESAKIVAGARVTWQATADTADDLTAVVHRKGDTTALPWAEAIRTLSSELQVDAVPSEAGEYVLTVTATNAAGTTTEELAFTVLSSPDGGSDSGSGDADGSGKSGEALSNTGSAGPGIATGVVAALAATLAAAGALLLLRRRATRSSDAE